MIAQELEVSPYGFYGRKTKKQQFVTVEHLLLALLDNPSASNFKSM